MSVSPFRIIRNFAAFLVGVLLACAALAHFTTFPQIGTVWRKYHHLEEHPDRYSLIYLGSSRVYHEFIPDQFDAALAQRGHPVTSFNFGVDGMWPPESHYMIEKVLALHQSKLRWVLIDMMAIKPYITAGEISLRAGYWHDWRHTWIAIQHCARSPDYNRTLGERLDYCYTHLFLWSQRGLNAGFGSQQFLVAMKLEREKHPEPLIIEVRIPGTGKSAAQGKISKWLKKDGDRIATGDALFTLETNKGSTDIAAEDSGVLRITTPAGAQVKSGDLAGTISDEGWEDGPHRHLNAQELKDFKIETDRLPEIPPKPIDPLLRESLDRIIAKVRAAGAEPVFIVASGLYGKERFTDWPPPGVKVIAFDDPIRYPELYIADHRFDMYHLNAVGAVDATRDLADRFAEYLEEKK